MSSLLAALALRLQEFGLRVDAEERPVGLGYDAVLTLVRGRDQQRYFAHLSRRATFSSVQPAVAVGHPDAPVLIGTDWVSPRSADAMRRAGIQFVDAAGNAWITFDDVLIDVRGRRLVTESDTVRRSADGRGSNLFSTGRAQVAFALLQWPSLWSRPQRETAEAAGVSLGQANNALSMFGDAGFGPLGHRSNSDFLDLWVASFPAGLGKKLVLATFRGSVGDFRKVDAEDPVFISGAVVSGEAAADHLLRPGALTVYVTELDPMLPVRNRWRSDGEPNITVRRKFWTVPPDQTHDYDGPLIGLRNAPHVLVYADLMASDDPRVREAAKEWRAQLVGLRPTD